MLNRLTRRIVALVMGTLLLAACDGGLIESHREITDLSPRFSPDGASIVFTSDRGGGFDLFIIEVDDSEIRQVTDTGIDELDPTWIPDGSGLVYVTRPTGERGAVASLAALDLPNEEIDVMASGVHEAFPDVADVRSILVSCRIGDSFDVCVRGFDEADGASTVVGEPSVRDWQAVWSPDRSTIAFTSNRTGNDDIYLVDWGTGLLEQLTDDPGKDSDPSWSPNGEQLAFSSDRAGTSAVWLMNKDGTEPRLLAESTTKPHWHPDGTRIVAQGVPTLPAIGVAIVVIDLATGAATPVSR